MRLTPASCKPTSYGKSHILGKRPAQSRRRYVPPSGWLSETIMHLSDKLLVLDLDETLVYASKEKLDNVQHDFMFDEYYVHKRPFLDEFLKSIVHHYSIGIWSSAGDLYVEGVSKDIIPTGLKTEFVWGRSRCTTRLDKTYDTYVFEKRLSKLKRKGFPLEKILIVDDSAEKVSSNYGNAIYIKEFKGEPSDTELLFLRDYLIALKNIDNVRTIEKRSWRVGKGGT